MTIGFGDFVPGNSYIYNVADNVTEEEVTAKLVLVSVYILLGMGIIAMCVNLMQEKIVTQVTFTNFITIFYVGLFRPEK